MTYREDYIEYIDDHIANVRKAYDWLIAHEIDNDVDFGDFSKLETLINSHDKSKWSDEEFEPYAIYFYKGKNNKADFNKAWNHHQKANPHHWQYWVLIKDNPDPKNNYVCIPMEQEYIVEMICDWWAFSHKSGNLYEIFDWYEENKDNQLMHNTTRGTVERILKAIKKALDSETAETEVEDDYESV